MYVHTSASAIGFHTGSSLMQLFVVSLALWMRNRLLLNSIYVLPIQLQLHAGFQFTQKKKSVILMLFVKCASFTG